MAIEKILWVVNYDNLDEFVATATRARVTGVAIRTDNDVATAIEEFHDVGIQVYGWRWPSAKRDPAMKEAAKVVDLFAKGLDGYYVDPEREPGKPYDWDRSGLDKLAKEFCEKVKEAAGDKVFGVTSHYRGKIIFPKLPWVAFFERATVFLPQAYWRTSGGVVGHGIPADNYRVSLNFWKKSGAPAERIVPMAGEIAYSTAAQISEYAAEASAQGISQLHFYTAEDGVKDAVWDAIAKL